MSTLMSTSHVSRPASPFHTYHHHHHPPRHCPLSSINAMLYSTYCTPHTFHIYVPRNIPLPPIPLLTFIPSVPLPPHFPSFCVLYSGGVVWCGVTLLYLLSFVRELTEVTANEPLFLFPPLLPSSLPFLLLLLLPLNSRLWTTDGYYYCYYYYYDDDSDSDGAVVDICGSVEEGGRGGDSYHRTHITH